jgi:hypothetical protein
MDLIEPETPEAVVRKKKKRKNKRKRAAEDALHDIVNDAPEADGPDEGEEPEGGGPSGGQPASPGAAPSPSPGTAQPAPAPVSDPPIGLTQVSDTKWTVTRTLLDKWMADPGKLASAKQRQLGYQLVGIKTGSDLWHAGLRNGDVIQQVNGYSLASQSEAIAAYIALQSATKLTCKLARAGGPRTHTYTIKG